MPSSFLRPAMARPTASQSSDTKPSALGFGAQVNGSSRVMTESQQSAETRN
jgi:hypothetical protein